MKSCSKSSCTQSNPQNLTEYTKDNKAKDGLQSQCNSCRNEAKRLHRLANPDKYKAIDQARWGTKKVTSDKWRENNRERYNTSMREYRKKNYLKLRLIRYNLTIEEYYQMLSEQKGVCKLCSKPPKGKRPLVVDHHHASGEVRGLLCYSCNRKIVLLDAPQEEQDAAKAYVDSRKKA